MSVHNVCTFQAHNPGYHDTCQKALRTRKNLRFRMVRSLKLSKTNNRTPEQRFDGCTPILGLTMEEVHVAVF